MMTTPETPFAAPKRASAMPAASASLSTITSPVVALVNTASTSVPIQLGSTFAAERATPCLMTAGKVAPMTPSQPASDTIRATISATRSGVDGLGVAIAHSRGQQRAGGGVDEGSFDAGTADVYAEGLVEVPVGLLAHGSSARSPGSSRRTLSRRCGAMTLCHRAPNQNRCSKSRSSWQPEQVSSSGHVAVLLTSIPRARRRTW